MFGSMGGGAGGLPDLMQQISKMQGGVSGAGANAVNNGFIAKMMNGNPGGFLSALLKPPGNAPVNPGAPPAAGDPAYVPGGQGPMAGGPAPQMPQMGMLAKLFGSGMAPPGPSGVAF